MCFLLLDNDINKYKYEFNKVLVGNVRVSKFEDTGKLYSGKR